MATKGQRQGAWNRAATVPGKNPNMFRQDRYGNQICKTSYGKNSPQGWEVDHKKPKARGGTNHPKNLQALQTGVNRQKSDHYPYRHKS